MKIVDCKTYCVDPHGPGGRNWVFVKLITSDGIEGIGEAYCVPFNPQATVQIIRSFAERFVLGNEATQIETMWRRIYASGFDQHPDTAKMGIISGLEIACWDIMGKAFNQPIYNLLGGKYHEKLRSYTYITPAPDAPPERRDAQGNAEVAAERAAHFVKMGFTALKFDPVGPVTVQAPYQLSLARLENAEKVSAAVREAVGSKCDLLIGTHGEMTTSSAIRLAKRLEKYDPMWFEEPVPPENRDEMARVARHTSIPIATGERLSTKYEFRELLQKQAAQILQFPLGRVGGILEAKKIAGMAEAYYAQIAPHLYAGPIEALANIHVDACSPNFLIQESIENWKGFYEEILTNPIQWEDGYIIPPTEPGIGTELKEDVMEKYAYKGTLPALDVSYDPIYD